MPEQTIIGTKQNVSEEHFLKLVNYIQMENSMVETDNLPDKFQISQFLAFWAESSNDPVSDLFYVMQRTRETLKLQLAKQEAKIDRLCCETMAEIGEH